ncbi:MAG: ABC transporter permease subunit [Opitutaceae bacterium]|nr:ABC transporter permease subunit [Verrucomicrobiales bacterium]
MTFLPIVERELRVASRRRSTHWARISAVMIGLLVAGWIGLVARDQPSQDLGVTLFYVLAAIVYGYALTIGCKLTADCLSEEKRDGTLGLLFLTDLRGYDIVLGKVVANSLNSFYAILALFPILAIPQMMGGVTSGQVARACLVAVNLLLFSLAIGMVSSAICRDERKSLSLAVGLILVSLIGSPLLGAYLTYLNRSSGFDEGFLLPSPAYACFLVSDLMFQRKADHFWICSGITFGCSVVGLVLSSLIVPRTWHDKVVRQEKSGWQAALRTVTDGDDASRREVRNRLLSINPFLWLAGRQRMKVLSVWAFLCVGLVVWMWGWVEFRSDWTNNAVYIATAVILHTVLKLWLAGSAARQLAEDRRNGALELLLSTPLSVDEILNGQKLALRRQFGWPVVVVLVVDAILFVAGLSGLSSGDQISWALVWAVGMVVFVVDLWSLGWLAMWFGLTSRRVNQASSSAVFVVMVLPWLLFGLLITFLSWFLWLGGISFSGKLATFTWFGISVGIAIVAVGWAKGRLRTRLRAVATEKIGHHPTGLWRMLGRRPSTTPPVLAA